LTSAVFLDSSYSGSATFSDNKNDHRNGNDFFNTVPLQTPSAFGGTTMSSAPTYDPFDAPPPPANNNQSFDAFGAPPSTNSSGNVQYDPFAGL
jgi:hypothetical protein